MAKKPVIVRVLRRDRKELNCNRCGETKDCSKFYGSILSICMECKRETSAEQRAKKKADQTVRSTP